MYYRLNPPYAFRGWSKLPFAIRAEYGAEIFDKPKFFRKEQFMELLYCVGTNDVKPASLTKKTQRLLEEMINHGILEASETRLPSLEPWQIYRVFPSRYLKAVHWAITGQCNYQCRHCLVSAPDHEQTHLPLSDLLRIADEIAGCGIKAVDITGGEPLIRKDFAELCKALSERDLHIRLLFTNAGLLDEDVLKILDDTGHRPMFQISFDGLGHHDWLRGVPGAEKQADKAFRLLQKHSSPVTAAMMLHRENRDSIRDTVSYLSSLGVKSLGLNAPQSLGLWKQYASEYALSENELWETYKAYIPYYFKDGMPLDIDLDGYFSCRKGRTDYQIRYVHHAKEDSDWTKIPYCESMRYTLHIRPDGRVAPCMGFSDSVLGDRFPSVLNEHLGDISLQGYYHDVVETRLSDVLKHNPECASCQYWPRCTGGCMVECMNEEGDYLIPDRRICYFHRNIGEEAVRQIADEAIQKYCTGVDGDSNEIHLEKLTCKPGN